ncbi:MAG TPA: efflux RND transporter periplasmic adaptor subunit [Woeseiaceae bacterium]|nr:efflux RND transporter periplasmic adaptor subunit [Woeseiaceae bacterium]
MPFLIFSGCQDAALSPPNMGSTPVRVVVEPLEFASAETRVEAVGTSRAKRSIALHPATSGQVVAVNFEPGQKVGRNDVLVELDSRDEKLAVELARVRLKDAERLLDRYQRSGSSGAVLPTQLDTAESQVEAARIELGRAQVALDDRYIKAPFAGFVDVTDVDPGDRINVDTLITTLDDRSELLVNFDVPEVMVGELVTGNSVELSAWNRSSSQLHGKIIEIGSRINPATRTFTARAAVDNGTDNLRPGMSFRVSINIEGQSYPVIAETAVMWGADGAYVWLIVGGSAQRTPVQIVQRQKGRVLVDADLARGDLVVVEGIQRMRNDVAVDYETGGVTGAPAQNGSANSSQP